MKAVDTNVLVYARRVEPTEHTIAERVLQALARGSDPWVLPWPCVYEFLRVVTSPGVFIPRPPLNEAWSAVELLLDSPAVVPVSEGERHREVIKSLLRTVPLTGNILHDAHIAAMLIEHGVDEIITADEDFRRFPGLKVTNPFRP